MTFFEAIVLGIIQGASEFLPISSSGHLILFPKLFGWSDHSLLFDEALNTGTLLAVLVYFQREMRAIVRDGFSSLRAPRTILNEARLPWMLALGTIPAGVTGLLIQDWVASEARNAVLVATNLIAWGLVLFASDRFGAKAREFDALGFKDALLIGCAQALSLIPGTSRSGITMTVALALGATRPAAARFSFLLSVPIGLAVALHDGVEIARGGLPAGELPATAAAFLAAAVSGFLVIGWLLRWLRTQSMAVFTAYRVALGLTILLLFA